MLVVICSGTALDYVRSRNLEAKSTTAKKVPSKDGIHLQDQNDPEDRNSVSKVVLETNNHGNGVPREQMTEETAVRTVKISKNQSLGIYFTFALLLISNIRVINIETIVQGFSAKL